MRDYVATHVNDRTAAASYSTQATRDRSFYDARYETERISAPRPAYPVVKGGLDTEDEELLYLARSSILGCALKHKGLVLLLVVLLFGSFFVQSLINVSLVATSPRGAALCFFSSSPLEPLSPFIRKDTESPHVIYPLKEVFF